MPFQRIEVLAGRSSQDRLAIADAVHQTLVETIGVPEKDRFQVVVEHDPNSLIFPPEYLGLRHQNPVLVQITLSAGRTLEQKQRLYRRMAELLEKAGVPASEVIVNLVEVAKENWSFGAGIAQYVPDSAAPRK